MDSTSIAKIITNEISTNPNVSIALFADETTFTQVKADLGILVRTVSKNSFNHNLVGKTSSFPTVQRAEPGGNYMGCRFHVVINTSGGDLPDQFKSRILPGCTFYD